MTTGLLNRVKASLRFILNVHLGQLRWLPSEGGGWHRFMFHELDESTRANLHESLVQTIRTKEQRIELVSLELGDMRGTEQRAMPVRLLFKVLGEAQLHKVESTIPIFTVQGGAS